MPALLTHGPILTHVFLLLSHLSLSMRCGVPCTWIICCQGLCFCDCTPRAPGVQGIHSSGQNGMINKICQILTFLVFGFSLEKLLLPLVAPSKAARSLSCVFDVVCLRRGIYRVMFFLLSSTHYRWAAQRRETTFNIQKLHGLYLRKIVLDKRKPTCSRVSKKRLTNKLFWKSFFQCSLKNTCSQGNKWESNSDCFWKCRVSKEVWPVVIQSRYPGSSCSHFANLYLRICQSLPTETVF